MWSSELRLALVQSIYQDLFKSDKLSNCKNLDILLPDGLSIEDSTKLESLVQVWRGNSDQKRTKVKSFFKLQNQTYLLLEAILLGFLLESLENHKKSSNLIKKYLKIGDTLIGGKAVGTLHAVLDKLSNA